MNQFKVQLVNSSSFKILLVMEYVPVSAQKKEKGFLFFIISWRLLEKISLPQKSVQYPIMDPLCAERITQEEEIQSESTRRG